MRNYLSVASLLAAAFLSNSFPAQAQSARSLPGCETAPEVRKILDEKLNPKMLDKMKLSERVALERQVLNDLIAKYPRELEPYQTLVNSMRSEDPDQYAELRNRLVKMAKDDPNDPLALLLAGWVLRGKDTPESLRLLEAAKAKAPNFPWPLKELASDYFSGKIADQNKVKENTETFFAICPASTDSSAQWLLAKDPALLPKVAVALRARLQTETHSQRLKDYEVLWGIEFRARPPAEHDALRAQLTQDLKRLAALNPEGDAEWQVFLIRGYKQSGASQETIATMEDALIHEFPRSDEAFEIVRTRWDKAHKEPEEQSDTPAWARYQKEYEEALKGWMRDYPDEKYLQQYAWFYAIQEDDTISEKDGIAALDTYLEAELPHLEKFYEKVKGRSDIQVLTFDIDEDLGLVAPYLKEKGYTFPVLPAYSTVVSLLDGFAIPQNWIVDPHGMWRWKQVGYGGESDADFEKEMLARFESTKTSQ